MTGRPGRGIVLGVLLALPLWIIIGATVVAFRACALGRQEPATARAVAL